VGRMRASISESYKQTIETWWFIACFCQVNEKQVRKDLLV